MDSSVLTFLLLAFSLLLLSSFYLYQNYYARCIFSHGCFTISMIPTPLHWCYHLVFANDDALQYTWWEGSSAPYRGVVVINRDLLSAICHLYVMYMLYCGLETYMRFTTASTLNWLYPFSKWTTNLNVLLAAPDHAYREDLNLDKDSPSMPFPAWEACAALPEMLVCRLHYGLFKL